MRNPVRLLSVVLLCMTTVTALYGVQNPPTDQTLQNFETAFNGESNAHVRYLAFATQADKEGYGEVGSLFRAAAKSEEIHAASHAQQIKKLGGTPQAKIEAAIVKSTRENLEAAIAAEIYERDRMYPEFRKQAWDLGSWEVVRAFNYARNAEGQHAKLFMEAYNNLDNMRGMKRAYYVCVICGYTTKDLDFTKCHSCFSPKDKFEAVS